MASKNNVGRLMSIADMLDRCRVNPSIKWTPTNANSLKRAADDARKIASEIADNQAALMLDAYGVTAANTSARVRSLTALGVYINALLVAGIDIDVICADIDRICDDAKTAAKRLNENFRG